MAVIALELRKALNEDPLSASLCSTWHVQIRVFLLTWEVFIRRCTSNTKYGTCHLLRLLFEIMVENYEPSGTVVETLLSPGLSQLFIHILLKALSLSWSIMLSKCFCTQAVKNNLILETISSSTVWWKVHICWCEPARVVVWQTFSSGNSKLFFFLFPWKAAQWLFNSWCRKSTRHRANNHFPVSSFHLSFPLISTLLFHSSNKTNGLLLMKQLPTTETGMESK